MRSPRSLAAAALAAAALALAAPAGPAAAQGLIAGYVAFIGRDDLYNSQGQRLTEPWQVLRQDRANFHRYGISQPGDQWDPVFHDIDARAAMERLLMQGSITPAARRDILRGGVMVEVQVYGAGGRATWIEVDVWR
ncbi:MAG: hypothetical protein KJZ85_05730 [Rhodobacteraceae bacterium]|jgi:hypothetical protein|nr:hypothetical protein [Paracoccaceae bacterium]